MTQLFSADAYINISNVEFTINLSDAISNFKMIMMVIDEGYIEIIPVPIFKQGFRLAKEIGSRYTYIRYKDEYSVYCYQQLSISWYPIKGIYGVK